MTDRVEVISYDDRAGEVSFPGVLLAQSARRELDHASGCRVYRGTHECDGEFFVCGNAGPDSGPSEVHYCVRLPSRSKLLEFLSGLPPNEDALVALVHRLAFAAMRECLAQLGEGN